MEYGSDRFDKNSRLLSNDNGTDRDLNKNATDNTECDYTDKTAEVSSQKEDRYDEIFDSTKRNTRVFSVISLVLAVVSLLCSFAGPVGFILGALSIGAALVSRKLLGYFDGICVFGLMLGIFASSFGIAVYLLTLFTDVFDAIKNLF